MNKISSVKSYIKEFNIQTSDLFKIAALLNTYIVNNTYGVPEYDRKEAKRLLKILRREYA